MTSTQGSSSRGTALKPSTGHADPDASSSPFREPTHKAKSVKYRYSATGKHLSSPLKGSSSSPESSAAQSKRARLAYVRTPAPHPVDRPAATTSRKRKAVASNEGSLSPLSSAPTSPTLSTTGLPPLPAIQDTKKRLPVSKTLSFRSFVPPSKINTFSPPPPSRKQVKAKAGAKKDPVDPWDIGNSVWVLVDQSGVLVDNAAPRTDSPGPFMWWPAQVVQKQPLRVSLFGEFPSSSSTSRGLCTIFAPSPFNVLSINDDSGSKRFSRATFCLVPDDDTAPPLKKPRLDQRESIQDKWDSAVQNMEKASTLEKDGLPALLSAYASAGGDFDDSDPDTSGLQQSLFKSTTSAPKKPKPTDSSKKVKSHRSGASFGNITVGMSRGRSPCPPDPTLQIPGELILAMAPKTGGFYWPAQILEHVSGLKEKYKVKFLDDEKHVITRDRFWTSEEEGFVHCTLGEWESAVKTTEDPDSGDEGGDDADPQDAYDSASMLPPPPRPEDFEDLSVRAQLAYVKPVLRAILNMGYGPVGKRHETFMKGGSGRASLLKSAGVRGGMDVRFVKRVQQAICEWVLGKKGVQPERLVTEDVLIEPGKTEGAPIGEDMTPEGVLVEELPRENNAMQGIEGPFVSEGGHVDKGDSEENETVPQSTPDEQTEVLPDVEMVAEGNEQPVASLSLLANGIALSPIVTQASLAPKSQLDLLAEVSQAVATEPSLLPSHPELPKLRVDVGIARKDTSPLPSPLTPISEDVRLPSCQRDVLVVCEEFEMLSAVEKLDYCLNILLPESIQQLLLWRSGERTCAEVLSPEEEQRLHDVGARKASETDWVDDVMRLREVQARLWGVDPNKKAEEKKVDVVQGGTRTRPRKETVSRP